jgi:hypothetical protein
MIMKRFLIIIMLLIVLSAYGVSEHACFFTLMNPSATGLALGVTGNGADIWNQNPLDVWSNPAKLGYFNGLSMGHSHEGYLENIFDDIHFDNSYLTYGWKGIGLMIPMVNSSSQFGTTLHYGQQAVYGEDGYLKGYGNAWENSSGFAIGANMLQFYGATSNKKIKSMLPYTDLSIGYNYNFMTSKFPSTGQSENSKIEIDSHTDGLGMIYRISPFNESNNSTHYLTADCVFSLYYRNLSKTNWHVNSMHDPIYFSTERSASVKLGVGVEALESITGADIVTKLSAFCQDIVSINANLGNSHLVHRYWSSGNGLELTFLDLVSYRWGNHENASEGIEGETSGYGLNLRCNDYVQLQYNYAKYPGNEFQKVQEVSDFKLNVNLLKLLYR